MDQQEKPQYIPVTCWKCGVVANRAVTAVCPTCGVFLRAQLKDDGSLHNPTKSQSAMFRAGVSAGVVVVVALMAVYAVKTARSGTLSAKPSVAVPEASWYQPGILNLYRQTPTAREIIRKANEVSGPELSPDAMETVTMSGKFGVAMGDCVTDGCHAFKAEQERRAKNSMAAQINRDPVAYRQYETAMMMAQMKQQGAPAPDNWTREYAVLGEMSIYTKRPNKTFTIAEIRKPGESVAKTIKSEAFNGTRGWQRELVYDFKGGVEKDENTELDEAKIDELQKRTFDLWNKKLDAETATSEGISLVNNRPCFVMSQANEKGIKEKFYFDAVSGYVIKIELPEFTVFMDEYKKVNGLLMPAKLYFRRVELQGFHSWIQVALDTFKVNEPIDDKIFDQGL